METILSIADVRARLVEGVRRTFRHDPEGGLQRVTVPVPEVDPFLWLGEQPEGNRAVWSSRGTDRIVVMAGIADVFEGGPKSDFDRLQRYLNQQLEGADDAIRYYGGIRFDAGRSVSPEWEPFGTFRFVLPRFELSVGEGAAELTCNLVPHRDRVRASAIVAEIEGLPWPGEGQPTELPEAVARHDQPNKSEWLERIDASLAAIRAKEIQKVVMARRSTFEFDGPVRPIDLIARLYAEAPNRFHYLFEAEDGSAFIGATPERLIRREDTYVFTEAVAGTRPAVDDAADDAALLASLMASDKDQREHLCVRWAIEEILRPFCEELAVDAHASEMRLSRGRHLVSRFNGILNPGVESWQLVRHLHPTPAVGGYPAPAAMRVIRKMESFDRGWYAGPVGWVGRSEAEFAVALRCALVNDNLMHIYSGAGIVEGSVPEEEWDEIEHKIVDFARVLGLAGTRTR